jgi:hypothetical protein
LWRCHFRESGNPGQYGGQSCGDTELPFNLNLHVAMFAEELFGPHSQLEHSSLGAIKNDRWLYRALPAQELAIAAGSGEIQHNIIDEWVLKLPKG